MEQLMKNSASAKRNRGGQPGNKNALKHGFFTQESKDLRHDLIEKNQQLADLLQRSMKEAN